jgi:AcrR family transcriptional regulator
VRATLLRVGYRHQREDLLAAAVEVARADGLGALTFGRVARHVGTNDRTVVYYFPTKADLIGAVLVTLGAQLQDLLAEAFGEDPIAPDDLVKRAWPVLARADSQPVFALFFEIIGLAAVGTAPYDVLAPTMLEQWLAWLEPRIAIDDPAERRAQALAVLARIDGLLLVRTIAGAGGGAAGRAGQRAHRPVAR